MNELATLKWYHYGQNNSGGYYVEPAKNVWVQGSSVAAIEASFESLGCSTEFCSCCGERWYGPWDDTDLTETPEYYGQPLQDMAEPPLNFGDVDTPFGLLVFADGTEKVLHLEP